jgi:hypothetical protein
MVQAQQIPWSSGHYCFGNLVMCFRSVQQRVNEIEGGVLIGGEVVTMMSLSKGRFDELVDPWDS